MTSPSVEEVRSLYSKAEAAIKLYERIGLDNLTIPLNELRYAGQHILRAEIEANAEESKEDLFKAYRHCERALYDAKEATILCLLETVASFREYDVTADEFETVLPGWREILKRASLARRFIETSGQVKDCDPQKLDNAISALLDVRSKLLEIEPQIMSLRERKREAEAEAERSRQMDAAASAEKNAKAEKTMSDRQFLLSFSATVSGSLIGLLGTLIAIYGTFPECRFLGTVVGLVGFVIFTVATYKISRALLVARPDEAKSELKGTTLIH
ncbi:MAG: hypothetical protein IKF72_07315 [Kiritimatiellae bacterium]|nr:hypothetical protein [Kiritimatiellia bacterium]